MTRRVSAESTGDFLQKNVFPPLLATILNFCVKRRIVFVLETECDRAILTKFWTHRVSAESTDYSSQKLFSRHFWRLFPKIFFSPLLVAILNFCVKRKYWFISETERDRVISTNFFTHRVSAESTGDFSQKSFGGHFEFLRKTQKTCLSNLSNLIWTFIALNLHHRWTLRRI